MDISLNEIVWFDNFISTKRRMYDYKTFMGLIQERTLYKLEYNNFFKRSENFSLLILVMTSTSHVAML